MQNWHVAEGDLEESTVLTNLLLSHEVAVVRQWKGKAMYSNCDGNSGLMRFLREIP